MLFEYGLDLPASSDVSDPKYYKLLENESVFLDVNVLLRSILFNNSHSHRMLKRIIKHPKSQAVISDHVITTALRVLKSIKPELIPEFTSRYRSLEKNKMISVVKDGLPSVLPSDLSYDPTDDDIVMASAISSGSTYLATLDKQLAHVSSRVINILPPYDIDKSRLIQPFGLMIEDGDLRNLCMYITPEQGSIILEVDPRHSAGKYRRRGRRCLFYTDLGFSCWLNERSWKYQFGVWNKKQPIYTFPYIELSNSMMIGISYDCKKSYICFCIGYGYLEVPSWLDSNIYSGEKFHFNYKRLLNKSISLLSRGDYNHFNGGLNSIATTRSHVGIKGLKFAMREKCHYLPYDVQLFPLEDATLEEDFTLFQDEKLITW